ncbi:MAG: hypothetical protein ABII07_02705 [Patescibacteria group bacterium]|nr:hypothetical protein [Patescibacteria group bacterium]
MGRTLKNQLDFHGADELAKIAAEAGVEPGDQAIAIQSILGYVGAHNRANDILFLMEGAMYEAEAFLEKIESAELPAWRIAFRRWVYQLAIKSGIFRDYECFRDTLPSFPEFKGCKTLAEVRALFRKACQLTYAADMGVAPSERRALIAEGYDATERETLAVFDEAVATIIGELPSNSSSPPGPLLAP